MIVGDDDVDVDEDDKVGVDIDNDEATHPKTCSTEIVRRVLTTWPNPGNIIRCLSLSIHVAFEKVSISKTKTFKEKNSRSYGLENNHFFPFLIAMLGTVSKNRLDLQLGPTPAPGFIRHKFVISHTFLETISSFSFRKSYHL